MIKVFVGIILGLLNLSKRGQLQESLTTYTHPHVLVIDEVGYLTCGPDAANVLFHVVNDRHLRKRPMIFTTNKPLNEWGKFLHDEDTAAAILDRVLEEDASSISMDPRGERVISTWRTSCQQVLTVPEFPEPTILCHGKIHERFCNTPAIPDVPYLLVFSGGRADCCIQITPRYIRAIVFLCAPLTRREPHRSIASTGRNSRSRARRKRGLS